MITNPQTQSASQNIKHSVSPTSDHLTHDEVQALIRHAPDDKTRLWIRLLHDTGLRPRDILSLRRDSLWVWHGIHHLKVRHIGPFDNIFCWAPVTEAMAEAIRTYDQAHHVDDLLFEGNRARLALVMDLCLRLAALRADIRKEVGPGTFRRMKTREFQRAGVGPEIVISAMGWSEDLGLARRGGARWSIETLREGAGVLGGKAGVGQDGDWKMRVLEWIKGVILG